jgi:hypothetical protein
MTAGGRHDASMLAIDLMRTDRSAKIAPEYLEQA